VKPYIAKFNSRVYVYLRVAPNAVIAAFSKHCPYFIKTSKGILKSARTVNSNLLFAKEDTNSKHEHPVLTKCIKGIEKKQFLNCASGELSGQ